MWWLLLIPVAVAAVVVQGLRKPNVPANASAGVPIATGNLGIRDPGFIQSVALQNSPELHPGDLIEVNAVQGSSDLFLRQFGLTRNGSTFLDPVLMRITNIEQTDNGEDIRGRALVAFFVNAVDGAGQHPTTVIPFSAIAGKVRA